MFRRVVMRAGGALGVILAGSIFAGAAAYAQPFGSHQSLPSEVASTRDAQTSGFGAQDIAVGDRPEAIAVDHSSQKAYVANHGESTVSVMDTLSNRVTTTVTVGAQPAAIAIDEELQRVYVANVGDTTVTVIDGRDNRVIETLDTTGTPSEIAVDRVTHNIYVLDEPNREIRVIDLAGTVEKLHVIAIPTSIAVDGSVQRLYVQDDFEGVLVVDTATKKTLKRVPQINAARLAVNEATHRLYAVEDVMVTVVDGHALTVIDTIENGWGAYDVAIGRNADAVVVDETDKTAFITRNSDADQEVSVFSPDGTSQTIPMLWGDPTTLAIDQTKRHVYVATSTGSLVVIDSVSRTVADVFTVGGQLDRIAIDESNATIYVTDTSRNIVNVVKPLTKTVEKTIAVNHPGAIAVDERTQKIYVASESDKAIDVIDGHSQTVERKIPVDDGAPQELVVDEINQRVIAQRGDHVLVIDASTGVTIHRFYLGWGYSGTPLGLDESTGLVYVAAGTEISVYDIDARKRVALNDTLSPYSRVAAFTIDQQSGVMYVPNTDGSMLVSSTYR